MDIVFEDEEKQSYYLWLGGAFERSTLMKIDDSYTIYILAEESTKKLTELMKK